MRHGNFKGIHRRKPGSFFSDTQQIYCQMRDEDEHAAIGPGEAKLTFLANNSFTKLDFFLRRSTQRDLVDVQNDLRQPV